MKNNSVIKSYGEDSFDRFMAALERGVEGIKEAILVAAEETAKDASWPDRLEDAGGAPAVMVAQLARRARRQIPELILDASPAARFLTKLPMELQRKYYSEPLPLLIEKNGRFEVLQIDLRNLTSDQARQVFADDHVRTDAEQRAWIEDRKAKNAVPAKANPPYRIVRGEVLVMTPCKFTRSDILRLLSEMEK